MSNGLSCAVSRHALAEALGSAARIVDKKVTIPIFSTVLLVGEGESLRWWATDGAIWRSGLVPAAQATGSGLVPAAQALAVVKACGASEVTLRADKSFVVVTAGAFSAKLPSLPREDYPTLPALSDVAPSAAMPSEALKGMLTHVMPAILNGSLDLSGALFRLVDNDLICVSTDRHQLAKVSRAVTRAAAFDDAVVSYRVIQELVRMLALGESVEFSLTYNRHIFRVGDDVLYGLPLAVKFPEWQRVIPKDSKTRFSGARDVLLSALDRVALAADDPQRHVMFSITDGAIELSAQSATRGEAVERLAVTTSGPDVSFALKPEYARNYIGQSVSTEIECAAVDELRQVVFSAPQTPDDIYIIMPMRR